jgi:hypothetical protein
MWGNDHPATLNTMGKLGNVLSEMGEHAEAQPLLEEALAGLRLTLGDEAGVATLAGSRGVTGNPRGVGPGIVFAAQLFVTRLTLKTAAFFRAPTKNHLGAAG